MTQAASPPGKVRWGIVFRYVAAGLVLAVGASAAFSGGQWFLGLAIAAAAGLIMFGGRRVLRPALTREPGVIVCRYVPWYEAGISSVFIVIVALTLFCFSTAFTIGVLWGVMLLALLPFIVVKFLRNHRRCLLRITPTALSVSLPNRSYAMADIPRGAIQSIEPVIHKIYSGGSSVEVQVSEITYSDDDGESGTHTVSLGPATAEATVWLTVGESNLLTALQVWRDSHPGDPEILDRVEAILRAESDPLRPW